MNHELEALLQYLLLDEFLSLVDLPVSQCISIEVFKLSGTPKMGSQMT